MNIYLDIETIPSQDPSVKQKIADNITAPGQYKKAESIKEWLDANRESAAEEEWRKTSFDGGMGQICCISAAINDSEVKTFYSKDWANGEAGLIADFFSFLNESYEPSRMIPPVFVGHNVSDFDLRFVFQRAVVLGIKPPKFVPFNVRSWDKSIFDTMSEWAGYGKRVSLSKLCDVLGLDEKGSEIGEEIDGSKVWDFVRDGKIDQVASYCAGDVNRVRNIHKKMTFQTE
ncbi:hypothetical protein [Rosenbergiella australiborealis]|uniref:hypothetical protein n=1 Tax=Rosenbergiella australiborealis TaxID=1544696 RepID=UPI001F4D3D93|nr:hypothetical protein [Rosenbergiella australiborealis]